MPIAVIPFAHLTKSVRGLPMPEAVSGSKPRRIEALVLENLR
jgi:hypothetical protein